MSFRNDLDALASRHAALEAEVAQKTRELDDAARLLEDAKTRARLPVLDNIRVASPCTADWAKMTGDERVRHCGDCAKNVYNISNMTRLEAEALIVEKEGKLCVRYYQRKDGTILLKDCAIGIKRKRRRLVIATGAIAMLAGGIAYQELTKNGREDRGGKHMMGDIAEEPVMGKFAPPPMPPEETHPVQGVPEMPPTPAEIDVIQGGISSDHLEVKMGNK